MRKQIYHSFLISCLCTFCILGFSAPPSPAQVALESANQVVAIINAETQRTWALQKHLEQFNRDLLQFSEDQPISLFERLLGQQLEPSNSFGKLDFRLIQAALYQQPEAFQRKLWEKIQKYRYTQSHIDDLIEILKPEVRCSEEVRIELMTYLKQVEGLFARQMHNHRQIRTLLEDGMSLPSAASKTAFIQPAVDLEQLIKESDQLLYMVQKGDSRSVESQVMMLRKALLKAEKQIPVYQEILLAQPNSHRDPMTRYRAVLTQAHELLAHAEAYIHQPTVPAVYTAYGEAYYYYNHVIGNKFSRHGDALVDQYHQFLMIGDAILPHQLIAPNWYQVINFPEEVSEQVSQETIQQAQTFVFLIDLSGSMRQTNKIDLFKQTFATCLESLNPMDRVSLVTYADTSRVYLSPTSVDDHNAILKALDQLQVGGSGSPEVGIEMAYQELQKVTENHQRVILITDGGFYIEPPLLSLLKQGKERSVGLDIMYLGKEEKKMRSRLARLAAVGGGNYGYLRADRAVDILLTQLGRHEKSE